MHSRGNITFGIILFSVFLILGKIISVLQVLTSFFLSNIINMLIKMNSIIN